MKSNFQSPPRWPPNQPWTQLNRKTWLVRFFLTLRLNDGKCVADRGETGLTCDVESIVPPIPSLTNYLTNRHKKKVKRCLFSNIFFFVDLCQRTHCELMCLFYSILFCSILFCSILFCSILFYLFIRLKKNKKREKAQKKRLTGNYCTVLHIIWQSYRETQTSLNTLSITHAFL